MIQFYSLLKGFFTAISYTIFIVDTSLLTCFVHELFLNMIYYMPSPPKKKCVKIHLVMYSWVIDKLIIIIICSMYGECILDVKLTSICCFPSIVCVTVAKMVIEWDTWIHVTSCYKCCLLNFLMLVTVVLCDNCCEVYIFIDDRGEWMFEWLEIFLNK